MLKHSAFNVGQAMDELKRVIAHTDGACSPNPGPGGYGVILRYGQHRRELSGGFAHTTNNRMEITAAIAALGALKARCHITIHSDSQYLVNAMTKGAVQRWHAKGWRHASTGTVINADLWARLLDLCTLHEVEFQWVRGHAGDPLNERCDELARLALQGRCLHPDQGYANTTACAPMSRHTIAIPVSKEKITREGQPCRKCSTPVVKRPTRSRSREGRSYYYEYYLHCAGCGTMYLVEEAKRIIASPNLNPRLL